MTRLAEIKEGYRDDVKNVEAVSQMQQKDADSLMEVRQRLKLLNEKVIFYNSEAHQLSPTVLNPIAGEELEVDE